MGGVGCVLQLEDGEAGEVLGEGASGEADAKDDPLMAEKKKNRITI